MELKTANQDNKKNEEKVFTVGIFSSNTWMTLAAPLVIGLFASKVFAKEEFTNIEATFFLIALTIHILFAILIFIAGNRKSTTLAVDQVLSDIHKYESEIIP